MAKTKMTPSEARLAKKISNASSKKKAKTVNRQRKASGMKGGSVG